MELIKNTESLQFAISQIKSVIGDIDLEITPEFTIRSDSRKVELWFETDPDEGFTWHSINGDGIRSSGSPRRSFVMAFF